MKIDKLEEIGTLRQVLSSDEEYAGDSYLGQINAAGMELLKNVTVPGSRDEEWRFTNIKPLLAEDYKLAGDFFDVGDFRLSREIASLNGYKIVFVNGNFREDLSEIPEELEKVMIIGSFSDVENEEKIEESEFESIKNSYFSSLNAALCYDGLFVYVMENQHINSPLHIVHFTVNNTGNSILDMPRSLLILGENSRLEIIESFYAEGENFSFINAANHFILESGSELSYYKIQKGGHNSNHIYTHTAEQKKNSKSEAYFIDLGGKLSRNTVHVKLNGEDISALANGIYFAAGDELVDNHVLIDHAKENGVSSELYRGILADKARGVFKGKIMVRPHAQKTDADQNNNCLLLSDEARINTMPQLEIYADDVQCTHGATVGELDDESVFYLRSRGIGEEQAKNILIKAFIAEVISKVENDEIKSYIEQLIDTYLRGVIEI